MIRQLRENIRFISATFNALSLKAGAKMSTRSRLQVENKGMLAMIVFYVAVGITFLVWMSMTDFPPHIGLLGVFSLAAGYGIIRKRAWSLWLVLILFFAATTLSIFVIYSLFSKDLTLVLGMVGYLIMTWVFTAYASAKRESLGWQAF